MQENKINETYAKVNIRYMKMKSTHWMDYLDNNHVYKWGSYLTFDFLLKNGSTEFSLRRRGVKHNRKNLLIEWNSTIVFYNLPFFRWVQNRVFYVQHNCLIDFWCYQRKNLFFQLYWLDHVSVR